ncbi:Heterokaryon incompatibility protein (HET) domain containing protein [Rhypophila decipiens]
MTSSMDPYSKNDTESLPNLDSPQTSADPTIEEILKLPPFQYKPLPTPTSIRLVQLVRTTSPEIIRCTMTTFDLESIERDPDTNIRVKRPANPYIALRYTWKGPITINKHPYQLPERFDSDSESLLDQLQALFTGLSSMILVLWVVMKEYLNASPWVPKARAATEEKQTSNNGGDDEADATQEDENKKPIELDGCLIFVQESLHDFLRNRHEYLFKFNPQVAESYPNRDDLFRRLAAPIWIDALCINQQDIEERFSQMQIIHAIYSCAAYVFAWLGRDDDHGLAQTAIKAISVVGSEARALRPSGREGRKVKLASFPELTHFDWFALFAFFQRSWFRRVWVVQEAIFGCSRMVFIVGGCRYLLTWDEVVAVAHFVKTSGLDLEMARLGRFFLADRQLLGQHRQLMTIARFSLDRNNNKDLNSWLIRLTDINNTSPERQDGISLISAVRQHFWRRDVSYLNLEPPRFIQVLSLFRGTDATDPRDKVFALLNLASDKGEIEPWPDYNDTVQQIFRWAAMSTILTTGSLSILSQVQEPCDTQVKNLEGWVPDFASHPRSIPLDDGGNDVEFNASGNGTRTSFCLGSDGDSKLWTLCAETLKIDVITVTARYENDFEDMLMSVLSLHITVPHTYPIRSLEVGVADGVEEVESTSLNNNLGPNEKRTEDITREENLPGGSSGCTMNKIKYVKETSTTRIEALWRSLVANMLPMAEIDDAVRSPFPKETNKRHVSYPAPDSLGVGFSNWVVAHLLEMRYGVLWYEYYDPKPGNHCIARCARDRFLLALQLYTDIYQERQLPGAQSHESPKSLGQLAALEQQSANPKRQPFTGDFNSNNYPDSAFQSSPLDGTSSHIDTDAKSPPAYFPSAKSLSHKLATDPYQGYEQNLEDLIYETPSPSPQAAAADPKSAEEKNTNTRPVKRPKSKPLALEDYMMDGLGWEMALSVLSRAERDSITAFETQMQTVMTGRRVFATREGLIGVGPRSMDVNRDDKTGKVYEVHVLKGAKVPYVLEKVEDGDWADNDYRNEKGQGKKSCNWDESPKYRVIGEAYVHGIMDGEALKAQMRDGGGWGEWGGFGKIRLV